LKSNSLVKAVGIVGERVKSLYGKEPKCKKIIGTNQGMKCKQGSHNVPDNKNVTEWNGWTELGESCAPFALCLIQ